MWSFWNILCVVLKRTSSHSIVVAIFFCFRISFNFIMIKFLLFFLIFIFFSFLCKKCKGKVFHLRYQWNIMCIFSVCLSASNGERGWKYSGKYFLLFFMFFFLTRTVIIIEKWKERKISKKVSLREKIYTWIKNWKRKEKSRKKIIFFPFHHRHSLSRSLARKKKKLIFFSFSAQHEKQERKKKEKYSEKRTRRDGKKRKTQWDTLSPHIEMIQMRKKRRKEKKKNSVHCSVHSFLFFPSRWLLMRRILLFFCFFFLFLL